MNSFTKKHRRILLFASDAALFWLASLVMFYIGKLDKSMVDEINLWASFACLYVCIAVMQVIFHVYDSLWRYASVKEYLNLTLSTGIGYLIFIIIATISPKLALAAVLTFSISCGYILLSMLSRFIYRTYRDRRVKLNQQALISGGQKQHNVVILGAGDGGAALLRDFNKDNFSAYKTLAFFDDDPYKKGRNIQGVPVLGTISDVNDYVSKHDVDQIVIAMPSISHERKKEIIEGLSDVSCEIKMLPDTTVVLSKESTNLASSIRNVDISDLLGRNTISLTSPELKDFISSKVVLVTGGGGSIGSELCRQIARLKPLKLIVFDIAENSTYLLRQELEQEFKKLGDESPIFVEIGSIRDAERVDELFRTYKPNIVFHAAAHKHVPLMEWNPEEAVKNNIFGTWNVYSAADKYGAERVVQISTDKAVSPTNVMGATKRYCEYMVSAMSKKSKTSFVAVRFGNVLGSAGSVIPIFTEQIQNGGPVTITHKDITRYFMTIPEAVSLVLKAGSIAKSGELMVLDMGQPVKIIEMAENLIRFSGLRPYEDIDIVETGLRPGEKLYEELLVDYNSCKRTTDEKIFIENEDSLKTIDEIKSDFAELGSLIKAQDQNAIVAKLRKLVPTFKTPHDVDIH